MHSFGSRDIISLQQSLPSTQQTYQRDDLADDGASNPHVAKVREMAKEEGAEVFVICAQIEQELAISMRTKRRSTFEDLGVESSGLDKLVAASYSLLGLISFPHSRRGMSAVHGL